MDISSSGGSSGRDDSDPEWQPEAPHNTAAPAPPSAMLGNLSQRALDSLVCLIDVSPTCTHMAGLSALADRDRYHPLFRPHSARITPFPANGVKGIG